MSYAIKYFSDFCIMPKKLPVKSSVFEHFTVTTDN